MKQNLCGNCVHYQQHYTFDQRKIFRVFCGHCTYLKVKTKRPYAKGCEHYQENVCGEDVFVSKEYLSKKLLEYMLKLDLLPEIYDKEME